MLKLHCIARRLSEKEKIPSATNSIQEFTKIYDAEHTRIFNYIYRRTGEFEIAQDICSETFLNAFKHFGKFKWNGIPIQSWLYRIATNEANQYFRKRKYRPALLSSISPIALANSTARVLREEREQAENEMKKNEQFRAVLSELKKLPIIYQEVISLKYFEQLKIREISLILDRSEGTIKSRLSRGITLIKQAI